MNTPAKRFSLSRLLAPVPAPPVASEPPAAAAPPPPAEPVVSPPKPRPVRAAAPEERHLKKKRSYSVDMKLCEDLELLAWYLGRSSSSVVEELMKKHLAQNRALVDKAREVRSAR